MLAVKIFALIFVISIVWGFIFISLCRSNPLKTASYKITNKYPWWYTFFGLLVLTDLVGLVYVAIYFLFFYGGG